MAKRDILVLGLMPLLSASAGFAADPARPEAAREMKPWVCNWWTGSAVDEKGLEFQSRELADKGFGGRLKDGGLRTCE